MLSKLSAGTTLASLVQLTDARLNTLASLQSSVAPMVQAQGTGWEFRCSATVDRLKAGPEDWNSIIGTGRTYTDDSFKKKDTYFKLPWAGWNELWDYWSYSYTFERLPEMFPSATLFGSDGVPKWSDVEQGYSGTCYILAAMAGLTEFPDLVKGVFQTNTLNDEGIYAIKFYIRGKPWLVTVDDKAMFFEDVNGDQQLNFASTGSDGTLWAPILQKAFAKLKGSYGDANGGFVTTGIRSLVGVPVFDYLSEDETASTADQDVFDRMSAANDLDYILGAGTYGSDTTTNACGVVAGHAYSLISAFQLKTGSTVDAEVYMIRNPWGATMHSGGLWTDDTCGNTDGSATDSYGDPCSAYNSGNADTWCGVFDDSDFVSNTMCCACGGGETTTSPWTDDYKSQVPHSVNVTTAADDGIFFIDKTEFLGCFDDFQIGHYRDDEGYTDNWIDSENGSWTDSYTVTVPAQSGDLYFSVETYYYGMVPYLCQFWSAPYSSWTLSKNGNVIETHTYYEYQSYPTLVESADYAAGDVFTVDVYYSWYGFAVEDYTVKVYSTQDLEVLDSRGNTNELHMDGTSPSGFTGWGAYTA